MRTVKLGDAGADTGTCDVSSDMRDELSGSSGGTSPVTSPGHCHHIAQKISQKHGPHVLIQIASRKDRMVQ